MRNQCDGCCAGIPLVNGAHRMGREGGYPDLMRCTAGLYTASPPPRASPPANAAPTGGHPHNDGLDDYRNYKLPNTASSK